MHVPCFSSVVPLTDDISRALISSSLVGELGTVCGGTGSGRSEEEEGSHRYGESFDVRREWRGTPSLARPCVLIIHHAQLVSSMELAS